MALADCGSGHIRHAEDVRAGEVPHCLVQCVLEGDGIRLRVQSGPAGWVYTARFARTADGYQAAWQDASYALRMWWANGRTIWIEQQLWERVAWRLRGLEEVLA